MLYLRYQASHKLDERQIEVLYAIAEVSGKPYVG